MQSAVNLNYSLGLVHFKFLHFVLVIESHGTHS